MRRLHVAVLLAVVGLAVLAHPLYFFAHHGQTSVFVHRIDELDGEPPSDGRVAYADLPAEAQRAVDAALASESSTLWNGDHDAAIEALERGQYVERDGTYYEYDLAHRGGLRTGFGTAVRVLLTGLGSLALVVSLLVARTDSVRPLDARSALAVPVVASVAVAATNYYDVAFSGASASYLSLGEAFGPLALLGVAVGAAVRRGDRRAGGRVCALGVVASLAAFVAGASLWLASLVALPLAVPALAFGYLLTEPESV